MPDGVVRYTGAEDVKLDQDVSKTFLPSTKEGEDVVKIEHWQSTRLEVVKEMIASKEKKVCTPRR